MAVRLSIQVKGAEITRKGLRDLKREVPRIAAQDLYDTMTRAKRKVALPAPPPSYPIQWASERQRKKVLALLREAGETAYVRKGRYELGWKVRRNPSTARSLPGYSLVNDWSAAQYVGGNAYGQRQQPMHIGRWVLARDAVEVEVSKLPKTMQAHIDMVARRTKL